jgi:hypothetical protein
MGTPPPFCLGFPEIPYPLSPPKVADPPLTPPILNYASVNLVNKQTGGLYARHIWRTSDLQRSMWIDTIVE